MKFYGVRQGRTTGVFDSWEACRKQVYKFPGAEYKAFPTRAEASAYVSPQQAPHDHTADVAGVSAHPSWAIWVDGSCFPQVDGSLRIGWGLLIKQDGQEVYRASGNDIPPEAREHRNVAGEIMGILKALEWCQSKGITRATLYYDYQGLESWAIGTWRTKLPFTQMYAQMVKDSGITIRWVKVKAHSGNPENETVDQLAKEAALKNRKETQ